MRVLVLGGYGLIGAEITRALLKDGFKVTGLGRDAGFGRRLLPEADWIGADIARLTAPVDWLAHLAGVDAVVNAAGALQDSPRDRLAAVHHMSIVACRDAMEKIGVRRFVQISAVGASVSASTEFMSTKALGDAVVKASSLDWVIVRPGLVIGRGAYGGTALLRMLAGFPLMTPLVHASARMQTVSIDDVTAAVGAALKGEVASRRVYDLVEHEPHSLREIVRGFRRRLGFSPARFEPDLPRWVGAAVALAADIAGALGWRSPLRSTALKVLSENVVGDGAPWTKATGMTFKSLEETLSEIPSTAQERVFARFEIVRPVLIVVLALYWIASGVVGFLALDQASAHLLGVVERPIAAALVGAASAIDIVIGAGLLVRATAQSFALISIAVAAFYLAAGTLIAPELWLDPLGVLVKVVPVIALAAAVALMTTER